MSNVSEYWQDGNFQIIQDKNDELDVDGVADRFARIYKTGVIQITKTYDPKAREEAVRQDIFNKSEKNWRRVLKLDGFNQKNRKLYVPFGALIRRDRVIFFHAAPTGSGSWLVSTEPGYVH